MRRAGQAVCRWLWMRQLQSVCYDKQSGKLQGPLAVSRHAVKQKGIESRCGAQGGQPVGGAGQGGQSGVLDAQPGKEGTAKFGVWEHTLNLGTEMRRAGRARQRAATHNLQGLLDQGQRLSLNRKARCCE